MWRLTAAPAEGARGRATGAVSEGPHGAADCLAAERDEVGLVRAQIDRILASETFARKPRVHAILSFILERTFAGEPAPADKYQIAVQVFRSPGCDAQLDCAIRVQMRRVRAALAQYYESEGRDDQVFIDFPRRSYAVRYSVRGPKA